MHISEAIIEQLNSQADLVELIGKHTVLKPAGREFKGCCPFHGEKTPSFYVNPQTNLYYCFGCHVKGNAITFLKEFERLSFMEAVKFLSEQTGIELPKEDSQRLKYNKTIKSSGPLPPAMPAAPITQPDGQFLQTLISQNKTPEIIAPAQTTLQNSQGDLYALLESVCRYYQYMLHQNQAAKAYFLQRGLSEETITYFSLGYAPEAWQHLEEAFAEDIEGLKILGLVRDSQKQPGRTFDLLRHRVIFPIKDAQGRVVGFAGRTLGDDNPKYINSSESPVFQKQHILYGLYESRQMRASHYMLVEGYMDVIALHQAGIYGAVAPMGTAANTQQIEKLLRYHDNLVLCFDGDEAGQKAAWRTLEIAAPILQDGKSLSFLTLPDNHDPDTYLRAFGKPAMQEQIKQAKSLSDYIYQVLMTHFDLSKPEKKAAAMAKLRQLTDLLPKNSSLKWWLNSDIYQKIKATGNQRQPQIDRISYTGTGIDPKIQLACCLLYEPGLLFEKPLEKIFTESGMDRVHQPYQKHLDNQSINNPDLPSWRDFADNVLLQVILAIQRSQPYLDLNQTDQVVAVNARAHFILSSLDTATKNQLAGHWRSFFLQLQDHELGQIHPLFTELLCLILKDSLQKSQETSGNLVLSEIYKKRLQVLLSWYATNNQAYITNLLS